MHYLRIDSRIESLTQILTGLSASINSLKKQHEDWSWYDGNRLLEEVEPIFGLALIAFQNYINGSIDDFPIKQSAIIKYYNLEFEPTHNKKSNIELIIGLANYFKHKGEDKLHKGTRDILEYFNLNPNIDICPGDSPVFKGISILNAQWDLFEIQKIVEDWREQLWQKYEAEDIGI